MSPERTVPCRRVACVAGDSPSRLIDAARSFSPWLESSAGAVWLDARGCGALWGSDTGLAESIARRAAESGARAVVGVGGTKGSARLAALMALRERPAASAGVPATFVLPPGGDRDGIADLPVEWLRPAEEAAIALRRWGVRRIGELAALPAGEVALRLGSEGARLLRAARAEDDEPIVPTPLPDEPEESIDLEWPVVEVEPLLFVLKSALDRLAARLSGRAQAFGAIALRMRLDRAEGIAEPVDDRTVDLAAPTGEVAPILSLLRVSVESSPPPAPVLGLRMRATPARTRPGQLSLFVPAGPSPQKLAVTLARLAALVGPDRVGVPRLRDEHRSAAPQAIRLLRPPRPAVMDEPARQSGLAGLRVSVEGEPGWSGRVAAAAGPWKLRAGWWSGEPVERDYWDVEIARGPVLRIFRDAIADAWFADGIYD